MKNLLPFFVLIFFNTLCFSQKLTKNGEDEFTGNSVKETSVITMGKYMVFAKQINNNIEFIQLFDSNSEYSMKPGDKFYFLFSDNSKLILEATQLAESVEREPFQGQTSKYRLIQVYALTPEQVNILQKNIVTKVRWENNIGNDNCNVTPRQAKKLLKTFNLLK